MLGKAQTEKVKAAAASCAKAVKRMTSTSLKTSAERVLKGSEPEEVYRNLTEIALNASVAAKKSEKNSAALRLLQSAYHTVVETWSSSPSEKHRGEMVKLFVKTFRSAASLRKA
jgi:hypothetical protein